MKVLNKILGTAKDALNGPFCSAVIAAAGASSRMKGEDKLFSELCGVPVLARTLTAFQNEPCIDEIIIVTREESIEPIAELCRRYSITKAVKVVKGGEERIDSVLIGVNEVSPKAELIAVQDGARPLVTSEIIRDTMFKAQKFNAAAPAVPLNDTVKTVKDGFVTSTPDRAELRAVQTPQIFNAALLKGALTEAKKKGLKVTDDCSAVEAMGAAVYLTSGSFENIKITTPVDIAVAEAIIKRRETL